MWDHTFLPRLLKKVRMQGGLPEVGAPSPLGPGAKFIPLVVSSSNHAASARVSQRRRVPTQRVGGPFSAA